MCFITKSSERISQDKRKDDESVNERICWGGEQQQMWGESIQRGGEFGGGRRVSADREQSFPSASLVNYIVRDPISAFTVHWTPPFLSTSSVCDLCDNIDVCSPHGHAEYRDLFLCLTAFLINFYQFPYTVMTFCRNIFIGNSEDKKISGNSW